MAIFDSDSMRLRYIYLDDSCDDTNPTGPVWSQMDARIVVGGRISEMGLIGFNGFFWRTGGRRRAATDGGASWRRGEARRRWWWAAWSAAGGGCAEIWPRERERDEGEKEREREGVFWGGT
ncbi:hypothetical protein PanWU01x14_172990 [Parasponia andersonii]|uniref:Uncharacterized protein n=1 Tax=Parasponia andersonii TaxID=3476 RepID=A0A2P5C949_PARAD|nr:hypothetical protein PanWU01x14_172990 [Parasponia andersonii]